MSISESSKTCFTSVVILLKVSFLGFLSSLTTTDLSPMKSLFFANSPTTPLPTVPKPSIPTFSFLFLSMKEGIIKVFIKI